ncbi:hypothetical protein EZV62_003873 [Acer yangbiense]|uniref:DUF4283 domain-containing protein n=1 Tax=Acer yangbiense TaxID=1000413 RepID=A0A5C7III1_9ROSI|nr:hypothetical protein EZV62_003873 [Acer yangbiense]
MSADEIAELCATMSLKEKEGSVHSLKEELKDDGIKKMSLSHVGKIFGNKLINRDAFRTVMMRAWRVKTRLTIEVVMNNIFTFHFQCYGERKRVLMGGPWSFDNFLLKIRLFLGTLIGDVLEINEGDSGDCDGKFIRIRVAINVDKPLRCCLCIDVLGDRVESVLLLKYERLPDHCFSYGRLGHKTRECTNEEGESGSSVSKEPLFGAWLRATSPTKRPMQFERSRESRYRATYEGDASGWKDQGDSSIRSVSPVTGDLVTVRRGVTNGSLMVTNKETARKGT